MTTMYQVKSANHTYKFLLLSDAVNAAIELNSVVETISEDVGKGRFVIG